MTIVDDAGRMQCTICSNAWTSHPLEQTYWKVQFENLLQNAGRE
jgi:hypothetical protein